LPAYSELLQACWQDEPSKRPSTEKVVHSLEDILKANYPELSNLSRRKLPDKREKDDGFFASMTSNLTQLRESFPPKKTRRPRQKRPKSLSTPLKISKREKEQDVFFDKTQKELIRLKLNL